MNRIKNIDKYNFFQFFNNLIFFAPVIVLFWQSHGLNMTQVMILQSIYAIGAIILEVPTGIIADKFGNRVSLICGALLYSIGLIFYGLGSEFWQFIIFELIVGAGSAFMSGADKSFLHQTLKSLNRDNDYQKIEGKIQGQNQLALAMGSILGGVIGSFSLGFALIATGVSTIISFLISLSFTEVKTDPSRKEKAEYGQIARESIQVIRGNKRILWLTCFFAVYSPLVWVTNLYPQPYLHRLNVPIVFYGVIFAIFSLVIAIGSNLTEKLSSHTMGRHYKILSFSTVIIMFVLGAFPTIWVFSLWPLIMTFALMAQTIVTSETLGLVPENRAATILSFQNLIRKLVYAVIGPLLGIIVDAFSLMTAMQVNAVILLITLTILFVLEPKIRVPKRDLNAQLVSPPGIEPGFKV